MGFAPLDASAPVQAGAPAVRRPRAGLLSRALSTDDVIAAHSTDGLLSGDDDQQKLGFFLEAASADAVLRPLHDAQVCCTI